MKNTKRKNKLLKHLNKVGFSNRLAIYILLFLLIGLVGGFILAIKSIKYQYVGSLACWTIVFTPMSTAISIVLSRIVDKSRAENIVGGIKYETAILDIPQQDTFDNIIEDNYINENINSPEI